MNKETCIQEARRRIMFVIEKNGYPANMEPFSLQTACESIKIKCREYSIDDVRFAEFEDRIVIPYGSEAFVESFREIKNAKLHDPKRFSQSTNYIQNHSKEGKVIGSFKWMVIDNIVVDGCEIVEHKVIPVEVDSGYFMNLWAQVQEIADGWLPCSTCVIHTELIEEEHDGKTNDVFNVIHFDTIHSTSMLGFDLVEMLNNIVRHVADNIRFRRRQSLPVQDIVYKSNEGDKPTYEFRVRQPGVLSITFDKHFNAPQFSFKRNGDLIPVPDHTNTGIQTADGWLTVIENMFFERGVYELTVRDFK